MPPVWRDSKAKCPSRNVVSHFGPTSRNLDFMKKKPWTL